MRFHLLWILFAGLGASLPVVGAPAGASGAHCATAWSCDGIRRIVAVGDVHGALVEFTSILVAAGVIDGEGHWAGGDTHFVSTGDLIDRGPDSLAVLRLLMRLEGEAAAAGGRVHVVLGNHEAMVLGGDLNYVVDADYAALAAQEPPAERTRAFDALRASGRYAGLEPAAARAAFERQFPRGYFAHRNEFSAAGAVGQWLLSRPLMVRLNGVLFVHGGLAPGLAGSSLEAVNDGTLHQDLLDYETSWRALGEAGLIDVDTDFDARVGQARERLAGLEGAERERATGLIATLERTSASPVHSVAGPLWYRGSAMCNSAFETDTVTNVLQQFGGGSVVIGHTPTVTRRVTTRLAGAVTMIDTGMLAASYQGRASALIIEGANRVALYADDGARAAPEPQLRRVGERPGAMSDAQLEDFLLQADVLATEASPDGQSGAQLLTLGRGGVSLRAIFITDAGAGRWENEVAAFRLDRLLGIDMVPVTVERTIGGRRGAVQFWIEHTVRASVAERDRLRLPPWCSLASQYELMQAFDALTGNIARTADNVVLETRNGMVRLVDHAAAFPTSRQLKTRVPRPTIGAELARRLRELDPAALREATRPWLDDARVKAVLARRTALLRTP